MEKPSDRVVALFDRIVPDAPGVERRRMFGMPAAFVNANMFVGVFSEAIIVRLPPGERERLVAEGGEPFAPMGRVMREYIAIPEALQADESTVRAWAERALAFAGAMPPKPPKKPTGKAAA